MYKFFGYFNEVESHNKSRQSDLAPDNFWVTQFGFIRLCTTVSIGTTITDLWRLFLYGFKRDYYDKLISITELLE